MLETWAIMNFCGHHKPRNLIFDIGFIIVLLASSLSAQQSSRALFNGKNLDGWQQAGPGSFRVTDGMMKTEGGMGLLWYTREQIAHSTIRVVFKLTSKESDSGVFIRIPEKPVEPWMPINRGYEVEIGDWPDDYSCTPACCTRSPRRWPVPSSRWVSGTRWTSPSTGHARLCT